FIVDAFPNRTFTGKVIQIRNAAITVQNVVTYDTVVEVNNPDLKLKPGMTANISITTGKRTGVLKIPNAALRFKPPEPATNQTFLARLFGKKTAKENKPVATNNVPATKGPGSTNKIEVAESSVPPLTGNEPPEELMRRVREMRERGEEVPTEI